MADNPDRWISAPPPSPQAQPGEAQAAGAAKASAPAGHEQSDADAFNPIRRDRLTSSLSPLAGQTRFRLTNQVPPNASDADLRRRILDLATLLDATHYLTSQRESGRILQFVLNTIRGHLSVPHVRAFFRTPRDRFREYHSRALPPGADVNELEGNDPMLAFLVTRGRPFRLRDLTREEIGEAEKSWRPTWERFIAEGVDAVAPLLDGDVAVGFVTLSADARGAPLDPPALDYLDMLSHQLVAAFRNARTIETLADAEKQLKSANEELRALAQKKRNFIQIAAHELNTPLSVIDLFHELLQSDPATPKHSMLNDLLPTFTDSLRRLKEINAELLLFLRSDDTRWTRRMYPVDMSRVLDSVEEIVEVYRRRRPEVKVTIDRGEMPIPAIRGIEAELERVWINLVQNAFSAISTKGGRIDLRLDPDADAKLLRCSVSDNGVGIPAARLATLFDEYFDTGPIENHFTSKIAYGGRGLGLGLSITHKIIERHGGTIRAESKGKNKGTTMTFELPMR